MSVEIGGVRFRMGFAAAVFAACLLNAGSPRLFALGCAAVLLHELTHLFLMLYYGCRNPSVEILPGAVRMRSDGMETVGCRQAAVIFLSAPAANLLAGGVFLLVCRRFPVELLEQAAAVHLLLGGINLLPMSFLDGGRALRSLVSGRRNGDPDGRLSALPDAVCLFLMAAAILSLAARKVYPVPFCVFFLYCAVSSLTERKKNC